MLLVLTLEDILILKIIAKKINFLPIKNLLKGPNPK